MMWRDCQQFRTQRKIHILVIYDISNDSRRRKVSKVLERFCIRVQESCFETVIEKSKIRKMLGAIRKVASKEDDVRLYYISDKRATTIISKSAENDIFEKEYLIL